MLVITNEAIKKCYDFAVHAWNNSSQSQRQFGTEEPRQRNSFIADQLSGKLAECLYRAIIEDRYPNVKVHLDFEHYLDPLHTDNGDVKIYVDGNLVPYRIDIKGSSHRAQWLLVEGHKFRDLNTGSPLADCYIMIRFSESMPTSRDLRNNPEQILEIQEISGEITGWAYYNDFFSQADNREWFIFKRGDYPWKRRVLPHSSDSINDLNHLQNYIRYRIRTRRLTNTDIYLSVPLDARINTGLPIHWLRTDINELLQLPALKQ